MPLIQLAPVAPEDQVAHRVQVVAPVAPEEAAAVADDRVLGYASFGDWRPFDGFRATVEHSIYVHADARGQGLSRQLMQVLMDRARALGKHVMVAGITSENEVSLALHRKLGFTQSAHMREVGQKFGRWLDLIFLELRLDPRPHP